MIVPVFAMMFAVPAAELTTIPESPWTVPLLRTLQPFALVASMPRFSPAMSPKLKTVFWPPITDTPLGVP